MSFLAGSDQIISKSMWVALDLVGDYSSANHYLN
jgi:hypothetical protein